MAILSQSIRRAEKENAVILEWDSNDYRSCQPGCIECELLPGIINISAF